MKLVVTTNSIKSLIVLSSSLALTYSVNLFSVPKDYHLYLTIVNCQKNIFTALHFPS